MNNTNKVRMNDIIDFTGHHVILWPSDTRPKFATIVAVTELGFLFRITKDGSDEYKAGDVLFVNHTCHITFKLVDPLILAQRTTVKE